MEMFELKLSGTISAAWLHNSDGKDKIMLIIIKPYLMIFETIFVSLFMAIFNEIDIDFNHWL